MTKAQPGRNHPALSPKIGRPATNARPRTPERHAARTTPCGSRDSPGLHPPVLRQWRGGAKPGTDLTPVARRARPAWAGAGLPDNALIRTNGRTTGGEEPPSPARASGKSSRLTAGRGPPGEPPGPGTGPHRTRGNHSRACTGAALEQAGRYWPARFRQTECRRPSAHGCRKTASRQRPPDRFGNPDRPERIRPMKRWIDAPGRARVGA